MNSVFDGVGPQRRLRGAPQDHHQNFRNDLRSGLSVADHVGGRFGGGSRCAAGRIFLGSGDKKPPRINGPRPILLILNLRFSRAAAPGHTKGVLASRPIKFVNRMYVNFTSGTYLDIVTLCVTTPCLAMGR